MGAKSPANIVTKPTKHDRVMSGGRERPFEPERGRVGGGAMVGSDGTQQWHEATRRQKRERLVEGAKTGNRDE